MLEISDATSGAGVILEKTRIRGVLRGDSWGQPEIVNVSPDERIQRGEPVLTSGGDAIYPRGLAVGNVDRVMPQPEGTLVNVLIKPAANLARLEEVLVITTTGDQMPTEMQQDLSDAQQKASDVLAERLPSRTDPNAPADQQPDSSSAGADDTVTPPVRPPQPLHADHFTPSDTPPAVDLTPGQKITNEQSAAEGGGAGQPRPPGETSAPAVTAPRPAAGAPKPKPKQKNGPAPITPPQGGA